MFSVLALCEEHAREFVAKTPGAVYGNRIVVPPVPERILPPDWEKQAAFYRRRELWDRVKGSLLLVAMILGFAIMLWASSEGGPLFNPPPPGSECFVVEHDIVCD